MAQTNEFEDRLRRAVDRGARRRELRDAAERQSSLSDAELKALHTSHRLALSEHIEQAIRRLTDILPGFRFELVYGDRGWGAAVSRDDFAAAGGQRGNRFSRLEMTIRPHSELLVLELTAKGTIRDKEVFNRSHFEPLREADRQTFLDRIDTWIVEFAELFSARS